MDSTMQNPLSLTASQLNRQLSTPELRDVWLSNLITLGEMLKPGAPVLDQMANEVLLELYSALLSEIGPERFVAAYKQVLNTSRFRPDISELRAAAGASLEFPIVKEAREALTQVLCLMRHHGWKLTNRGKPEKEPPVLSEIVAGTIRDMGDGSQLEGFKVVWRHPSLDQTRPYAELDELESFRASAGEKIERKWVEFYTRRKSEEFKRDAA